MTILLAPLGVIPTVIDLDDGKVFLLVYFVVSAYFSSKMIRLVLIMSAPATAALAGGFVGDLIDLFKAAYARSSTAAAARGRPAAGDPKARRRGEGEAEGGANRRAAAQQPPQRDRRRKQLYDENVGPRRKAAPSGSPSSLGRCGAPHCWRVAQSLSASYDPRAQPRRLHGGDRRLPRGVLVLRDHTP